MAKSSANDWNHLFTYDTLVHAISGSVVRHVLCYHSLHAILKTIVMIGRDDCDVCVLPVGHNQIAPTVGREPQTKGHDNDVEGVGGRGGPVCHV